MPGLIEPDLAAAGQPESRYRTPARFFYGGAFDAPGPQRVHFRGKVITHQVEIARSFGGGMDRRLGRRQREDQPAVTGIDCRKPENVAKEGAIDGLVSAVEDYVGSKDHAASKLAGT
jgi:hypothetical protein